MAENINPNPVEADAAPDESGMSVADAVESAYNDWDGAEHGISEGERKDVGGYLKFHADHAGTDVKTGLGALVETAAVLRNGSQEDKRGMLGHLADTYNITPMPSAEAPTQTHDEFGDPVEQTQQTPLATEAEATVAIDEFIRANPIVEDEAIMGRMIEVAADMQRQGYAPHLPTMLQHALAADPRYSDSVRQEQEQSHLARAKQGTGQVTGGGSVSPSRGTSDDVSDILNELIR